MNKKEGISQFLRSENKASSQKWGTFFALTLLVALSALGLTRLTSNLEFNVAGASSLFLLNNLIFASSLATGVFTLLFYNGSRRFKKTKALSRLPSSKNLVTLGSTGDETSFPAWVSIPPKGLAGNILITGSIGSGKTEGTIIPYIDQILSNFEIRPAILAIDPKRSFTKRLLDLASQKDLGNSVIHLSFQGKESFNPIYIDRPLKNGA